MPIPFVDYKERMAALDTTRSHHVESPAGSGKTLLLTMRFLKLLGEVSDPKEIVALTFTEKATAEMRSRIIQYLGMARKNKEPENELDRKLMELAKRALEKQGKQTELIMSSDGLQIMTFHGFCSYIARRAPLEAGLSPDFEIIEKERQSEIIEEAVAAACRRIFSYNSRDIRRMSLENRLLRHNNNWSGLSGELKDIIKARDRFEDLTRFVRNTGNGGLSSLSAVINDRLRTYIEGSLSALRKKFSASRLGAGWTDFFSHLSSHGAEAVLSIPPSLPSHTWKDLVAWQSISDLLLTKAGTPRKVMGPKYGFYPNFKKTQWGEFISELPADISCLLDASREFPPMHESERRIEELSDFIILAAEVTGEYEGLCRRRHVADFTDLEQAALRVLDGDNPSMLHLYLDSRTGHLLVDEFQDTNESQWELLKRLCSGWTGEDGRTVFIVGDPKQSIYAFRNAEVRLFLEAKKGIPLSGYGALPLSCHQLKTNFRSTKKLIGWINDLFSATVMTKPDYDADEVPFIPAAPKDEKDDNGTVSLNLFCNENREKVKESEAFWLAGKVNEILRKTGGKQSIAVLLFTRNRLQRYLKAFRDENIPVRVEEGLDLKDRPEVRHLVQSARAFVNPHDDLAWASLLRSPWSWFDIKTLHDTASQSPEGWMEKIRLVSASKPGMKDLAEACDQALLRLGRDPLGKILRRFWEDLDGPRKTAYLYGMAGVSNCRRFFRLLEDVEKGIPQDTLNSMERIIDSVYEPLDPQASLSPVQLMTVHRAKGLEFDVVFIPFMDYKPLESGPKIPPPYLLERIPGTGGKHVMAMASDYRTGESSKTYRLLRKLKRNREWGEAKRLFYVAATRARRELFMSGIVNLKDDTIEAPEKCILRFVLEHENIRDIPLTGRNIDVLLNPGVPCIKTESARKNIVLPEAYSLLSPEKIPYMIKNPSSMDSDRIYGRETTSEADQVMGYVSPESIRGTIIHNIIKTGVSGGTLPSVRAVSAALYQRGIQGEQADRMASEILEEGKSTLNSPFINSLVGKTDHIASCEVAIEDVAGENRLRSGIVDLLVFDGQSWWICDFKTARPGDNETSEAFVTREKELYRHQLNAYASMLSHLKSINESDIRRGIYLTSTQRWVEY